MSDSPATPSSDGQPDPLELLADEIANAATRYIENFEDWVSGKREQALDELAALGLRPEHIQKIHRCLEGIHVGYIEMFERDDRLADGSISMQ